MVMKKTMLIVLALMLAVLMLGCGADSSRKETVKTREPITLTPAEEVEPSGEIATVPSVKNMTSENWMNNILTEDPLDAFGIDRDKIYSVTFLDDLDDVPGNAWNMGKGSSSRVKGWIEWNGSMADIYFAADGGINGENSCGYLFGECINMIEVSFNGAFHTEYAETMERMFYNCASLKEVDAETLDTSSVESMAEMFRGCTDLEELDVGSFDTGNVTTMYCMFSTCRSLEELDLSSFDTSKVKNMGFMFSACKDLELVMVGGFDTSRVSNMEGMFRWCDSLQYLDIAGWDMGRVTNYADFMNPGTYYNGEPWENLFK